MITTYTVTTVRGLGGFTKTFNGFPMTQRLPKKRRGRKRTFCCYYQMLLLDEKTGIIANLEIQTHTRERDWRQEIRKRQKEKQNHIRNRENENRERAKRKKKKKKLKSMRRRSLRVCKMRNPFDAAAGEDKKT